MGQASFLFKIRLVFTYSIDLQIVLTTYIPLSVWRVVYMLDVWKNLAVLILIYPGP